MCFLPPSPCSSPPFLTRNLYAPQAGLLLNATSTPPSSYVEPCTKWEFVPDAPWTGHAVGAIVGVSGLLE
jgi:hypothetical protein